MYCTVRIKRILPIKAPHPPAKRAECVPESIETLQQNVVYRKDGRMSEIFTNRDVSCKVEVQKNPTCKEPHPPAKRAECVPESIETLQKNVVYRNGGTHVLNIHQQILKSSSILRDLSRKVEVQKNPTCKEPHHPAKRAECVPESIKTLEKECCI
ncbi:hypothetical protein TNCT_170311 [Trichonephila clavata]|uniref:Uncharacterized protein n=1 Tax=Trichonephila clavata TaxID=2740835 RepID=A0A8X6HFZ1_TRICU|nr:hypothetical protein TNCT_170311 [Trichonephila clavata]